MEPQRGHPLNIAVQVGPPGGLFAVAMLALALITGDDSGETVIPADGGEEAPGAVVFRGPSPSVMAFRRLGLTAAAAATVLAVLFWP